MSLVNPGMGITDLPERFNGQELNSPLKWSEFGASDEAAACG